MVRMKDTKKLINNALRMLPLIPFIRMRRRSSVVPIVLGAIGAAVVGGIAAVMVFSPRTRYRALDIAKDKYGKVRGQIDHLGWAAKQATLGERRESEYQNGRVGDPGYPGYSNPGM
jgi:hypothetical protein